jgi:hypothetical protein
MREQARGSMAESASQGSVSTARLILLPAVISAAVTILRLVGELQHWSSRWFSTETGGIVPDGVSWVIGITWMAPLSHYDYVGMPAEFQMPVWPRFFWLAFFPQLIFWVGYTILTGALTGTLAYAIFGKRLSRRRTAQSAVSA